MVEPSIMKPKGLSANITDLDPRVTDVLGRTKQGVIGKVSFKTLLLMSLFPSFDPPDPLHILIPPGFEMKLETYQYILNKIPWQATKSK